MVNSLQSTMNGVTAYAPTAEITAQQYGKMYRENCDRIYCLAFWMTGSEMAAERLSVNTFLRAFSNGEAATTEQIDRAFIAELREHTPLGTLTLNCAMSAGAGRRMGRIKRTDMENAVVQLPATEKLIFLLHDVESYHHEKIARLLGMTEAESREGIHQARLQVREFIAGTL